MNERSVGDGTRRPGAYLVGQRVFGVLYGTICHATFAVAISAMMYGLYSGMSSGLGRLQGTSALFVNAALLLQFPLLHSLLLTERGRRHVLSRLVPGRLGPSLATTTFATISSLQILSVFALWSFSDVVWWQPRGLNLVLWGLAFCASWILLLKAMWDAGLAVQTGFHGWAAVARGTDPAKVRLSRSGTFRYVRQPVYVAFALTLWTGPVWTPDHLAIAVMWTAYCVFGPLLKERRYLQFYGEAFREYRNTVPYWLPLGTLVRRMSPVR